MKRIIFVAIVALLLSLSLVNAITQQEINESKSLIDSKADCKNLSDSRLEIIGEYYMEQMHPGEAHEFMHKMMGLKEGSEAEEQFHINMAKTMYCGESDGMMGFGGMMGSGMMRNLGYGFGYWNFINVLYVILLIGLIILVYLWIIKVWRRVSKKRGK